MVATPAGRSVADRATQAIDHLARATRAVRSGSPRGFTRPEHLLTATQLRAFLAFADAGSFAGAAAVTGLSSPTLHRAVRDLERLCLARLVETRGRGVVLTDDGRRIARGVRLAAAELAAAIAETRHDAGAGASARLTIGAMPLCRAVLLPAALARLVGTAPRVSVTIVEGSWRELVEPLRDGGIDMMIGALRSEAPADLVQQPVFEDQLIVVGRAGHPLAGLSTVTASDLARFPWITGVAGTPLHVRWTALFDGHPLPPAPIACGSIMVARGVLGDSDVLALASPDQVALEVRSGVLAQIGTPLADTTRTIGVTTRHGWRPSAIQARFTTLIEEIAAAGSVRIS
ncbi:MAG: LysR family transcriptional regulator [Sphingomonas sp.]|nr:MAG: LysR family transcriptional regulator [Sphingomonas sp.]